MLVFGRGEKRSTRRKTSRSRKENQQSPLMTPSPGIEPRPHWWKASALTTAPTVLPTLFAIRVIKWLSHMWFQTTHFIKTNKQTNKKTNTSTLLYYFPWISDYGLYLWQIAPPLRESWPGMAWSWSFCWGCSRKRSSSYWVLGFYRWDPPTNSPSCPQSTNYVQWS